MVTTLDGDYDVDVSAGGGGRWAVVCSGDQSATCCELSVRRYTRWLFATPFEVRAAREGLAGRVLGCGCRPHSFPCHAGVLSAVANCSDDEMAAVLAVHAQDLAREAREDVIVSSVMCSHAPCGADMLFSDPSKTAWVSHGVIEAPPPDWKV